MKRFFVAFVVLLLMCTQVSAYQVQMLTTKQGLPGDKVLSVLQDQQDFLWIATEQGVVKFDGYRFSPFPKDQALRDNLPDISAFFIDSKGRYWLGTLGGLYLIEADGVKYQFFRHDNFLDTSLSSNMIIRIYEDSQANIWIATYNGLNRHNPSKSGFDRFNLAKSQSNMRFVNVIIDVKEVAPNKLWLAATKGVFELDAKDGSLTPVTFNLTDNLPVKPGIFFNDASGQRWVGTSQGLIKYAPDDQLSRRYLIEQTRPRHPANSIQSILQINDNTLWVTTKRGGYQFDMAQEHFERLDFFEPLDGEYIGELIKDTSGVVWVSSFGGLMKVAERGLEVTQVTASSGHFEGFSDKGVLSIYEKSLEEVYVGTWGDGLYVLNLQDNTHQNYRFASNTPSGLNSNSVWSIHEDDNGLIWLGTGNGVSTFDPLTKVFDNNRNNENFVLKPIATTVLSIDPGDAGQLWISTGLGLYHYDLQTQQFRHYFTDDDPKSLSHNVVREVLHDSLGNLWVATRNGINLYHPEDDSFTRYYPSDYKDGLQSNSITGLAEVKPGTLMLTPATEVYWFDVASGKGKKYQIEDARLGVLDLLVDDKNNGLLWLFGSSFAGYWDRQSQSLRNLSAVGSLKSSDFIDYASSIGRSGTIYLGSDDGLHIFRSQKIDKRVFEPKTGLTELLVDDTALSSLVWAKDKQLTLTHDQQKLSFEMVALDFLNTQKNRYRYKLDGYDDLWHYRQSDRRFVTYNNLDPGDYLLNIQGSNADGVFGQNNLQLALTVDPSVWQTLWFRVLMVFALIGLVFGLVLLRTARIRNHALELAKQVAERTEEITEQKQTIESLLLKKDEFFANVSHEFRTPLALILGPVESALGASQTPLKPNHIQMIKRNANRLLRMVDQLLAFAKVEAPQGHKVHATCLNQLMPILSQSFEPLAEQKNIEFGFWQPPEALWVAIESENMEKIVLNLLSNALKYTPDGGRVFCELTLNTQRKVQTTIEDSAIGIAPEHHEQVFERFGRLTPLHQEDVPGAGIGLALVKSLVDAADGQISLQSEAGKGAVFCVCLNRYLPDDEEQAGEALVVEGLVVNESPQRTGTSTSTVNLELASLQVPPEVKTQSVVDLQIDDRFDESRVVILIIEDNADMRQYIADSLGDRYQCLTACNGKEGVDVAREAIPDLIISDIMMPELDGYSLTKMLKEDDKTSHIPIILLTALSDTNSRKKGWQQQADDYLTKPFDVEELHLRVDNLLLLRNMLKQRFAQTLYIDSTNPDKTGKSGTADISELPKAPQGMSEKDKTFLDKLETVMERQYHDPDLSVVTLGSEVAMAERQLRRKLKALLNHGPAEYIRAFRLKKAAEKIIAGEQIQMAALDAGFSSYSTFIASFKARYGMSPSEYVNQGSVA
ncbi:MAG: response regulator [Psychrosphaera sp.]|nr:response regulator [Psychrosphaera sp.]